VKKLFIGNLAAGTTAEDLSTMCAEFGEVSSSKMAVDRDTGVNRAFGFVEMQEGADSAIQGLNNRDWKGRPLTVNEAKPKMPRPNTGGFSGDKGGDRGGPRR
jgi:cold-inducible RNA-binding protein